MTKNQLITNIKNKESFLCIGLDTDINKIPPCIQTTDDPIFEFNKRIIDKTHNLCVAYKLNTAFYECLGAKGWASLEKTINYIPENIYIIADAKRGDIGNTSNLYARAFFENLNVDAITIAPYMGHDAVTPYLEFKNKWVILLGVTSNPGALDFQFLQMEIGKMRLFEKVISKSSQWGSSENMMYVVGATQTKVLNDVRKIIPNHFLLVPGVGAQGGSLEDVFEHGATPDCGILVNSSRNIIYASPDDNFAEKACESAKELQNQMKSLLINKQIIPNK